MARSFRYHTRPPPFSFTISCPSCSTLLEFDIPTTQSPQPQLSDTIHLTCFECHTPFHIILRQAHARSTSDSRSGLSNNSHNHSSNSGNSNTGNSSSSNSYNKSNDKKSSNTGGSGFSGFMMPPGGKLSSGKKEKK